MPTEKRPRSTISESGSENVSNHGDDLDDQTEGEVEDEVPLMEDSETEDQDQEHERYTSVHEHIIIMLLNSIISLPFFLLQRTAKHCLV